MYVQEINVNLIVKAVVIDLYKITKYTETNRKSAIIVDFSANLM